MNHHRIRTARIARREGQTSALDRLGKSLEAKDDAWYAERLELLGTVLFGELWKPGEPEAAGENRKLP